MNKPMTQPMPETMKLQFEEQAYQLDAVAAFVDLFEGQTLEQIDFAIEAGAVGTGQQASLLQNELGLGNAITISDAAIYDNLVKVQERNDIDPIAKEADFTKHGMNFSVEMETGTGKTYVYLRTIFTLNQKYGFKKFIIVVPSVAIREGTLKTFEITAAHFSEKFNINIKKDSTYFVYNSQKPSRLRDFATSNQLQIMIINIDAFNKDVNKFNKNAEVFNGHSPKDFVQATQPIVLIDEPQSVDNTDKAKDAIASLNPACIFRFSATHTNAYNLLYKLDPIKAYELRLVKQIVVASVTGENAQNDAYIKLLSVDNKKGIKAKVRIQVQGKNGVSEKDITIKQNDDLYIKSNERTVYQHGFQVLEINADPDDAYIDLSSGRLRVGEERGGIKEDLSNIQIEQTIRKHLDKELQLKGKNIKVLSLFFIDKVANYRSYDENGNAVQGKYAALFEQHYQRLIAMPQYQELAQHSVEQIHNGYFSADKKGAFKDTNGGTQADDDTYSLIMRDKEKLLSMDTPLKFIFSHSALREGWDNPNVFQICTLNETKSATKKRQEIGRGLRLPVSSDGKRVFDDAINKLTIIANESYDEFAATLQKEYEQDCGVTFGKLPKLAFKGLLKAVEDGQEINLTAQESEAIHQELQDKGFVDDKGRFTKAFMPTEAGFSLGLSTEFAGIEQSIIQHMQSFQIERHISKPLEPKKLKINRDIFESEEFRVLWDKIKYKTSYQVEYETPALITACAQAIKKMDKIEPIKVLYQEAKLQIEQKGISSVNTNNKKYDVAYTGKLPDILAYLQRETNLTRRTLVEILKGSGRLAEFSVNPQRFMDEVVKCIQQALHTLMMNGIKYTKLDDYYSMSLFKSEELNYATESFVEVKKSVYETVVYDSGVEKRFMVGDEENRTGLETRDDIQLFVKLPKWFKIETPISTYNPDWAIVKKDDETLYMVRETKGIGQELRNSEQDKITCAKAHFKALEVDFKKVSEASEI